MIKGSIVEEDVTILNVYGVKQSVKIQEVKTNRNARTNR